MESINRLRDKISVETVKQGLMQTAMGSKSTVISRFDPRVLILWYLVFALVPWFTYDKIVLTALFLFAAVICVLSRVNKFVIILLCAGVVSEIVCYALMAYFIGGGMDAFLSLMVLTEKLLIISLASISIFTNMDPERLSDALLSWGMPGQITFAVSYGYRMVPLLIEEYNNIINSYRLRGKPPEKKGFLYSRQIVYLLKIAVLAFYPLVFNTAKRTRTTVEALETRGFSYALGNKEVKKLRLAYLKVRVRDIAFLGGSVAYVVLLFILL